MPQVEEPKRGGSVSGARHNPDGTPGGGKHFVLQDTGKVIEEEKGEINIPWELRQSKEIHTFTGKNRDILNSILKLANLSISDDVGYVISGDVVICLRSAEDETERTLTGTVEEIIHQINTSNGCKPVIRDPALQPAPAALPLNSEGGYEYSGESRKIAKRCGLVTLPNLVPATNCGNCIFNQNNFCDHYKVLLPITDKMCCAFWDDKSFMSYIRNVWKTNFFGDKSIKYPLNKEGGYDYTGKALETARNADLITLPPGIEGTNCAAGNCMYRDNGLCIHPRIKLPVTDRMSCGWWDNTEVIRPWGKPVELEFENGGEIPKNHRVKDWQAETPHSPRWKRKKESLRHLSENIERLRRNVARDMQSPDERIALTALAVAIMDKTAERVGNETSAGKGKFGVTGFKKDHVDIVGKKIHFKYNAKTGVKQDKDFSSLPIANALKKAIRNSKSDRIFETSDGFQIKDEKVNRYLENYGITAKVLRGYNANRWIIDYLNKEDGSWQLFQDNPDKAKKARKKIFNKAVTEAARRVGHGKGTLRKHYMVPELASQYINGGQIIDMKNIGYYNEGSSLGDLWIGDYFVNPNVIPDIVNKKTEEIYLESADEGIDKVFNSQEVKIIEWDKIVPTQDFLKSSKWERLKSVPDLYAIALPWVIEYQGKYYLNDGHHRVLEMHERGIPIKAHVYPMETMLAEGGKAGVVAPVLLSFADDAALLLLNEGGNTNEKSKTTNMKKIDYPKERLPVEEQSIEERELQLFIENDADLYRQRTVPIRTNLVTKIAKGVFDITKAPLIYKYLIDDGINRYSKDYGGIKLTKAEKENLAKTFVNEFLDEAQHGSYENYLPKKYQMAEGGEIPFREKINLGKVDYEGRGRKINAVDIETKIKDIPKARHWDTLKEVKNVPVLSISGNVWNSRHSDIISGGQNYDTISELFPSNKKVQRLVEIWKEYHLNDMKAGTKLQTEALNKWRKENNIKGWDYDQAVEHLKSVDLYKDKGYSYGSGWLYEPIPGEVIKELKSLVADLNSTKMQEGSEIESDFLNEDAEMEENSNGEEPNNKPICACFYSFLESSYPDLPEKLMQTNVNSNADLRAEVDEAYMAWGGGKIEKNKY